MASARLYFHHGTVSSGKSLNLISFADSLLRRNKRVYCTKPNTDTRTVDIYSRVGVNIKINCDLNNLDQIIGYDRPVENNSIGNDDESTCNTNFNVKTVNTNFNKIYKHAETIYLIIDEAQFLSPEQINKIRAIANNSNVEIHCYGLRTDFKSQLFPGSKRLFEVADKIDEIKAKCTFCDNNAIMNVKHCGNKVLKEGESVEVGFEEMYLPVCFVCYTCAVEDGVLPGYDKENVRNNWV